MKKSSLSNLSKIAAILNFIFVVLCSPLVFSAESDTSLILKTLQKYHQSPLVIAETQKIVESDLLEKKTTSTGRLYLSQGKFRWNTEKPEVSQVIFDGKYIYSVQDGQAVRSKVTNKVKQQSLMAVLFEPKKIQDRFEITAKNSSDQETIFNLKPKAKDMDISNLKISITKEKQEIKNISYTDEMGNSVNVEFKMNDFKTKPEAQYFSYKPKPGEKIIDL